MTEEEQPIGDARFEELRSTLAEVRDDPDAWLEVARRLNVDSVLLFKRTRRFPRGSTIAEVDTGVEGVEEWAGSMRGPGRYVLRARIRNPATSLPTIVSACEFDVPGEDPDAAPDFVAPAGTGEEPDMSSMLRDLHKARIIEVMGGKPQKGGGDLEAVKLAAELVRGDGGGIKELIGPLLQTNATLMTALVAQANEARREVPGLGTKFLAAIAPALPGLAEAAFDRFLGGGVAVAGGEVTDFSRLDWMSWFKAMVPKTMETYPQVGQNLGLLLGNLAGVAGAPPPAAAPGQPAMEGAPMARVESAPQEEIEIRNYVIAKLASIGRAKAEEDRGPACRELLAFLDGLGAPGVAKMLDALPGMDLEGATVRLKLWDRRVIEPEPREGLKTLIEYLRAQPEEPGGPEEEIEETA